jgi:hypothetical protein
MSYRGRTSFTFNFDDADYSYEITDAEGNAKVFEDIQENTVVTIISSKDGRRNRIILSNHPVEGIITELTYSDNTVFIDGMEYKTTLTNTGNSYLKEWSARVRLFRRRMGKNHTIRQKLSVRRISLYRCGGQPPVAARKMQVTRLARNKAKEEKTTDDVTTISYKFQNGKMEILSLASSVKLNGAKTNISTISQAGLTGKVISYRMNGSGEISEIDTFEAFDEREELSFNSDIMSFGGNNLGQAKIGLNQVICVRTNPTPTRITIRSSPREQGLLYEWREYRR